MLHEPIRRVYNTARAIEGTNYPDVQRQLAIFNHGRLTPGLGEPLATNAQVLNLAMLELEESFVRSLMHAVQLLAEDIPTEPDSFVRWFTHLRDVGPGQGDCLFPWLANEATAEQMNWFLRQEVAGEAGFDDLVALTQLKMTPRPKLEMARNYWDEMGRGDEKGMHGLMLTRLADHLSIDAQLETTVPESLALGNLMMALACNRRYGFHSVGALGVIELTAPTRAVFVSKGLDRLGVPKKQSHYFSLHAVLDIKHAEAWNEEVIRPLVHEDGRRARAIAEGALMRLWCGARCFERYRKEFSTRAVAVERQ